jgi:hypothetical protein
MKSESHPQRGISGEQQAEYESVGADVLVEHVRDDMKTRVATLRARLRASLGRPDEQHGAVEPATSESTG